MSEFPEISHEEYQLEELRKEVSALSKAVSKIAAQKPVPVPPPAAQKPRTGVESVVSYFGPAGAVLAAVGIVLLTLFKAFSFAMTFCVFGAILIGLWLAADPNQKILGRTILPPKQAAPSK